MRFRVNGKEYRGALAAEVVRQIERDTSEYPYPGGTLRQFILWSLLLGLPARVSLNELGLSDSLSEEMLALCYLFLCDEYGLGDLEDAPVSLHGARSEQTRRAVSGDERQKVCG